MWTSIRNRAVLWLSFHAIGPTAQVGIPAEAPELTPDFAAELDKLKEDSKLSWQAIEAGTGISVRALINIKTGKTKNPSKETRDAIAGFFTRELHRPVEF